MKLEIARALFLVAGLAVTTVAVAAWEEPRPTVFSKAEMAEQCALPRDAKPQQQARSEPDQDLLLFLFGLRQGLRSQG
ncbi:MULTISPECIES: hypothetical protein [Pseudomonas]|jgi:hypothetical protein|uniref:Lipoprotein n=1 Tax=Pseudomonas putida S12 TaxID=1215087 RepID=A0AA34RSJ5_PSEPU|nr:MULTISPECIES: hypothetical protein [Pseudomonas]ADR58640.1 Hypothetical protein, conserved [Pseudomonas putida BIRD-1]AJA12650.1 hypothetical protein RPPX_04590 [Pseudomonas putida S12]AOX07719.1 hypothetical protein Q5O_04785 [Pseudomonas putida JB]MCI1023159.1 hypothetical protein [Pseudomonas putida]MDN4514023.1 hypothetical protein [Pseudomonas sp. 2,4-D]